MITRRWLGLASLWLCLIFTACGGTPATQPTTGPAATAVLAAQPTTTPAAAAAPTAQPTTAPAATVAPTAQPTTAPTAAASVPTTTAANGDTVATPFDVSVAQFQLDSAGFHGMAEVLSDTKTIDPTYQGTVTRLTKVLRQTTWPSELSDQAQAFATTLDSFATALRDDQIEDAVTTSEAVHDAQHDLSHAIDNWIATNPAKATTASPFDVSVTQFYLDSAGFHGMAEVLSDTKTIDPTYQGTVTRLTKVVRQTTWPSELNDQAQAFVATLDSFATALRDDQIEDAVTTSEAVHDAQHDLSHAIDNWLATNPAKATTVSPFDVSLTQFYLDSAGFHGMAEVLSDTKTIDPTYQGRVTRLTKVLRQTTWPSELNDQAQAFVATLDSFATALRDDQIEDAVTTSEAVHDAQHDLSHAIDTWLGGGGNTH